MLMDVFESYSMSTLRKPLAQSMFKPSRMPRSSAQRVEQEPRLLLYPSKNAPEQSRMTPPQAMNFAMSQEPHERTNAFRNWATPNSLPHRVSVHHIMTTEELISRSNSEPSVRLMIPHHTVTTRMMWGYEGFNSFTHHIRHIWNNHTPIPSATGHYKITHLSSLVYHRRVGMHMVNQLTKPTNPFIMLEPNLRTITKTPRVKILELAAQSSVSHQVLSIKEGKDLSDSQAAWKRKGLEPGSLWSPRLREIKIGLWSDLSSGQILVVLSSFLKGNLLAYARSTHNRSKSYAVPHT
ncbi:putative ribonuclease H protein [Senna tora]|uniref:Putative ribonuclease H protein n=1 Tax=Senna tora TaxID=362788 RepID=A0A834U0F0_9FABA|nr:putative ribonuclease H protein [Senna tora]